MTEATLPDQFVCTINHHAAGMAQQGVDAYSDQFNSFGPRAIAGHMAMGLLPAHLFQAAKWYALGVQQGVGICQSPTVPKISATKDQKYLRIIQAIFEELHDDLPASIEDSEKHFAICYAAMEKATRKLGEEYQKIASKAGE